MSLLPYAARQTARATGLRVFVILTYATETTTTPQPSPDVSSLPLSTPKSNNPVSTRILVQPSRTDTALSQTYRLHSAKTSCYRSLIRRELF